MNGQQVVERIGFAERWLDRAKRQCKDGDVPRGLLTLFLANAEVTHALRMAHERKPSHRRWLVSGFAVAAAFSLALVALASSAGVPGKFAVANFWGGRWQVSLPAPASSVEVPIIVTFNHQPGALLQLVESAPNQVSVAAAEQVLPQVSPTRIRSAASVRRRLVGAKRSVPAVMSSAPVVRARPVPHANPAAQTPQIVSPVASAPTEQTAAAPIPSDVELINLVLTAERTLRTQSRP